MDLKEKVKTEEFWGFVRNLESLMNEEEFQKLGEKMKKHLQWLKDTNKTYSGNSKKSME